MKKLVCVALLVSVAGSVQAVSANYFDQVFLKVGVVNSNYNIVDEKKFRQALSILNDMIKEKSATNPMLLVGLGSLSWSPDSINLEVILPPEQDRPMTPEQLQAYREYNTYNVCNDGLGTSEVFRKRNMKVVVDIFNQQHNHLFKQEIPLKDCYELADRGNATENTPEAFKPLIPQKLPE